ncbi:CPBP family intramembrane glutamic endopeptidase [Lacinutrix sp. Bg11-31]|uniref:CPBP family intramembrane glutamic endopeptidase n=1 Tax=Lacinutrix sp. Bg11-31 TaxID=2057808 RepID=UPI000C31ACB5|nr:type II CAAX endopeptidase family protein [Lacinutrix sp. Bg11-31]AUC83006.1 CPBP family intramembrane metalloprotease [Lacinutrix sp. Bg11-31]
MDKTFKIILLTLASFGLSFALRHFFYSDLINWINLNIKNIGISHFVTDLIIGIPLFIGVGLIHDFKNFIKNLGLNKSIKKALLFSLICTSPMFIGYFIVFDLNSEITFTKILRGAFIAAFIEELFFRGILFGQIYRFTKIGFFPSIIFGALIFALGHLYQSQELSTLIGVFLTTFLGAILFAWVYVEWDNNLWVSIFLHLFMNLFWMLFSVADNAFGGTYANVFRIITIILVITLTIAYKFKKGIKLEVNKSTLIINK